MKQKVVEKIFKYDRFYYAFFEVRENLSKRNVDKINMEYHIAL